MIFKKNTVKTNAINSATTMEIQTPVIFHIKGESDGRCLKYQCPQERNQRGGQAVIQGGKKAGAVNGKAHKDERIRQKCGSLNR